MGSSTELKSTQNELCGQAGLMLLFTVLLQVFNSSVLFSIPIYVKEIQNYYNISSNCVAILGLLQTAVSLTGKCRVIRRINTFASLSCVSSRNQTLQTNRFYIPRAILRTKDLFVFFPDVF